LLSAPFRGRFGIAERLAPYPPRTSSASWRARRHPGGRARAPAARLIAERARGTPRIANRFLRRVRDLAQVRGVRASTRRSRPRRCSAWASTQRLEDLDRRILRCLARNPRIPLGIKTIAAGRRRDRGHDRGGLRAAPAALGLRAEDRARPADHRSGCRAIGIDPSRWPASPGCSCEPARRAPPLRASSATASASSCRARRRTRPRAGLFAHAARRRAHAGFMPVGTKGTVKGVFPRDLPRWARR
jgi:hypothetical protein